MAKQTLSTASELYYGKASTPEGYSVNRRAGVPVVLLTQFDLGAVTAAVDDLLIDDATGTEVPDEAETVTYTTAEDGTSPVDKTGRPSVVSIQSNSGATVSVWELDFPRTLDLVVTHATSIVAMTVNVVGYDQYRNKVKELFTITATGTSKTVNGKKAFKYIESIAFTAAADASTNTAKLGTSNTFGLPYVLAAKRDWFGVRVDGAADTYTLAAGDATTATASTGDVRGTVLPGTTPDGAKVFTVWYRVRNTDTGAGVIGVPQFGG